MPIYSADRLRSLGRAIFEAVGAPEPVARRVADALVDANLVGHDSHGVIRIPSYVNAVRQGHVIPTAEPEIVNESASYALVNGNWTFGQVSAAFATKLAIAKAKEQKVAAVGVVRCSHIGRLGEYAMMAAEEGVLALIVAGGFVGPGSQVAPFGGARPTFGTNPLSFGAPAGDQPPVVVDFATSAVASGKILVARAKGEQLPPGSIIDRDGRPTTDPEAFYNGGMLLPFGGHKGYSLALVVSVLSAQLTGVDAHGRDGKGSGTFILGIDAGSFRSRESYGQATDALFNQIKGVPPAPGFTEVLIPGEPEERTKAKRGAEGVPVPETIHGQLIETARSLGTSVDSILAV